MSVESSAMPQLQCQYCGLHHSDRSGPRVKAFEYHPNGTLKRVEFHGPAPVIKSSTARPPRPYGWFPLQNQNQSTD